MLATIPLDRIATGTRLRNVNEAQVETLMNSIGDVGLLNPITVYPRKVYFGGVEVDGFGLIAGLHRKTAAERLGLVEIEAQVLELGDLERQIAECDENLCGPQLSPSDRVLFTRRRKEAYEALHPEAKAGAVRARAANEAMGHNVGENFAPTFTADTARRTGQSERAVQLTVERGKIVDDALDRLRGTHLDTGIYLDSLKRLEPEAQIAKVERDLKPRVNGSRAIMASRNEPSDSLDYFPTPPWATRALIEDVLQGHLGLELRSSSVWEPACGEGHISGVLEEYFRRIEATDIFDYSADGRCAPGWSVTMDFLDPTVRVEAPAPWIITNPPFADDKTLQFALRALSLASAGVALFVRSQWLVEGVGRYRDLFQDKPPTLIAFFSERVNLRKGLWDPEGSTATAYSWAIWIKGMAPMAPFWIPPDRRTVRTKPDDVERFTAHPVIGARLRDVSVPPDINQIIRDGYARNAPLAEIATATGLSRDAVKQRARTMHLGSRDRQRQAVATANRKRARK